MPTQADAHQADAHHQALLAGPAAAVDDGAHGGGRRAAARAGPELARVRPAKRRAIGPAGAGFGTAAPGPQLSDPQLKVRQASYGAASHLAGWWFRIETGILRIRTGLSGIRTDYLYETLWTYFGFLDPKVSNFTF